MDRFKDKTVLITGGAQGLGAGLVRGFCAESARTIFCDTNRENAEDLIRTLQKDGLVAEFHPMDVSAEKDWIDLIALITRQHGYIDILINNAGVTKRGSLLDLSVEDWEYVMDINVKGTFLGMKHVIPLMVENGKGSIINVSSVCGLIGHRFSSEVYSASKGAVTLLTKSAAVHWAASNIRINSIHPSTINTPIVRDLFKDKNKLEERMNEIPLGRLCTVADVMEAVFFLASDNSSFITGVSLPVDGGLTAC